MLGSIPEEVLTYCESKLGPAESFRAASGGCINNGGLIRSKSGSAFIKWNSSAKYPEMFQAEAKGLNLLRAVDNIITPRVIGHFEGEMHSGLLLEYIAAGPQEKNFWEHFGRGLAQMHRGTSTTFGLDHHNYIGSLRQYNYKKESWLDFFIKCRLQPQIELAKTAGKINTSDLLVFDKLLMKLPNLLVNEPPALVHGDLWNGNFIIDTNGHAVLIDPAVAYSHREMDLAMTQLFGGFDSRFYGAYHEAFPLADGFEERFNIYNLYPLLVHVNLFGGGYYTQVLQTLKRHV